MTKYVFDIDGTICNTLGNDYYNSQPILNRIEQVNLLFEEGHRIIFHTARGMGSSGENVEIANSLWRDLTLRQLKQWNVKYHALFFGKPSGDLYIDDKGLSDVLFFNNS